MKILDKVVFGVYIVTMVVLLFLHHCSNDILVFVLGAVVAAIVLFAMVKQSGTKEQRSVR